jgi:ribosomal protein S18 acetylase RimI-like enzyme
VVNGFEFSFAESTQQIGAIRELFLEYAHSLGFSLCFQGFDQELATLPGDYAPPEGRLVLDRLDAEHCEMKRLFVRPQFRGRGLGLHLAERIIADARQIGYKYLRLDTVEPVMRTAVAMYRRLGFIEIQPYRPNPIKGALYMELHL